MWPEAKIKDREMFTHLNFEFDLNGGKIIAETAAKDYHGVPLYQYIYDTNQKTEDALTKEIIDEADAKLDELDT